MLYPRVVFVANYMNHHQLPFSEEMIRLSCGNFVFVAFTPLTEDAKSNGYQDMNNRSFVIKAYDSHENLLSAQLEIMNADMVIFGGCPDYLIEQRKKTNKPYIIYSERFFKKGTFRRFIPITYWKIYKRLLQHQGDRCSIIASSAYLAYDLSLLHAKFKIYKWGYFTSGASITYEEILSIKRKNTKVKLLWTARLIPLKHPEMAIKVAKKLKSAHYDFSLDIIGEGMLHKKLQNMIDRWNLQDCVQLLGSVPSDTVRAHMQKADIFIFTSDQNEGWGAVMNEAMSSGCAVVASHEVGSVPFLVEHGFNGLVFRSLDIDDLYEKTRQLIDDGAKRLNLGYHAYNTINNLWSPEVAARRIYDIIKAQVNNAPEPVYNEGPCSIASVVKPSQVLPL